MLVKRKTNFCSKCPLFCNVVPILEDDVNTLTLKCLKIPRGLPTFKLSQPS